LSECPGDKERAAYVDLLEDLGVLSSDALRHAFSKVKRHRFLEGWYRPEFDELRAAVSFSKHAFDPDRPTPEELDEIYSNRALVTAMEGLRPTSSTSEPALVARMLELLELEPGMSVLEIGTGTGYNAALIREIVGSEGHVFSIELQENVAERARAHLDKEGYGDVVVLARDAYLGAADAAPFDRIVATAGCSDISPHWLEQLAPDGLMLIPLQHGLWDPLVRVTRDPENASHGTGRVVGRASFMPIQGALHWRNPWEGVLSAPLPDEPTRTYPLPECLAAKTAETDPFDENARWRPYWFFLSFASPLIYYPNRGFGVFDPAMGSVVLISEDAMNGYAARGHTRSLDNLRERLAYLVDAWDELGQPSPEDYVLRFVPKFEFQYTDGASARRWIIGRLHHLEIAELP
jgi:protein-L-isoaspartate(D-aspartate) O-methyltransferase